MLLENWQTEYQIIYQAEAEDQNKPLKQVLKKQLDMSSRLLSKLKQGELVLLNGIYAKYHEVVQEGDLITILMKEEPNQFLPQSLPFDVVYEDVDLLVVNKQAGLVVHPTKSHPSGTLANGAAYYLAGQKKECRIRFVNRLDMDTSGLLVIAKNPYAHHILSEQMQADLVEKKYIAFVHGRVESDEGTINAPIYRPSEESIQRVVDSRGQESITKYRVMERFEQGTMLDIRLLTGRTHQIRVHMSHMGHPIMGDALYGGKTDEPDLIKRHALHAYSLVFQQPRYRHRVQVEAPLAVDMKAQLERLGKQKRSG